MRSLYSDKHRSRLSRSPFAPFLGGRSPFSLLSWSAEAREAFPLAAVAINSGAQVKADRGESAAERRWWGGTQRNGATCFGFGFGFGFGFVCRTQVGGDFFVAIVSAEHFPFSIVFSAITLWGKLLGARKSCYQCLHIIYFFCSVLLRKWARTTKTKKNNNQVSPVEREREERELTGELAERWSVIGESFNYTLLPMLLKLGAEKQTKTRRKKAKQTKTNTKGVIN